MFQATSNLVRPHRMFWSLFGPPFLDRLFVPGSLSPSFASSADLLLLLVIALVGVGICVGICVFSPGISVLGLGISMVGFEISIFSKAAAALIRISGAVMFSDSIPTSLPDSLIASLPPSLLASLPASLSTLSSSANVAAGRPVCDLLCGLEIWFGDRLGAFLGDGLGGFVGDKLCAFLAALLLLSKGLTVWSKFSESMGTETSSTVSDLSLRRGETRRDGGDFRIWGFIDGDLDGGCTVISTPSITGTYAQNLYLLSSDIVFSVHQHLIK